MIGGTTEFRGGISSLSSSDSASPSRSWPADAKTGSRPALPRVTEGLLSCRDAGGNRHVPALAEASGRITGRMSRSPIRRSRAVTGAAGSGTGADACGMAVSENAGELPSRKHFRRSHYRIGFCRTPVSSAISGGPAPAATGVFAICLFCPMRQAHPRLLAKHIRQMLPPPQIRVDCIC